ncbi:VOC family protein [Actinomadura roseirufa]|uniref:VOC family protein n=1 Tax=Actinomadura roseirufa TaxID=2094049 RepID=UPI001040EC86|nr:VOC family protein [Actinomadura roseirufa]
MTVPAYNTVAWFQVGTEAPEEARRFYGDLFGWRFAQDPDDDGGYDLISYAGAGEPSGGISRTSDPSANHATFMVLVDDVDAVCTRTEQSGGKVAVPATTGKSGLRFAHLIDPAGNRFGVFKPR